jgi:hypothetical protein
MNFVISDSDFDYIIESLSKDDKSKVKDFISKNKNIKYNIHKTKMKDLIEPFKNQKVNKSDYPIPSKIKLVTANMKAEIGDDNLTKIKNIIDKSPVKISENDSLEEVVKKRKITLGYVIEEIRKEDTLKSILNISSLIIVLNIMILSAWFLSLQVPFLGLIVLPLFVPFWFYYYKKHSAKGLSIFALFGIIASAIMVPFSPFAGSIFFISVVYAIVALVYKFIQLKADRENNNKATGLYHSNALKYVYALGFMSFGYEPAMYPEEAFLRPLI